MAPKRQPSLSPSATLQEEGDHHEGQRGYQRDEDKLAGSKVRLKERLQQITWAWFTWTMSTGGISLVLANTPHRFTGLTTIGKVFFLLDLVIYILLIAGISVRFITKPKSFKKSLSHPTESLFFPTFWISMSTLITLTQTYGGPSCGFWLVRTTEVLFWLYSALTILLAVFLYWVLFYNSHLTTQSMTPAWNLPAFPIMLSGTVASALAPWNPPANRLPMLIGGVLFQGLGWMVSLMMYPLFISRLMAYGLPAPGMRPGMFIAVGPPAFTSLALIGMANAIPEGYAYFAVNPDAASILRTLALFLSIFIWGVSFWFFCVAAVSCLIAVPFEFSLTWWAFIFPNVGLTVAAIKIGEELQSEGILWVGSAMTCLLVAMWLFVLVFHLKAIATRKLLWPVEQQAEKKD
ncbi:hypothetical protein K402DRAFT_326299 [Aulographum hederae CBS 113979]|uniref:C4-dicarboxylate transporter/malic acid transport protein n=1 Tax=Aulographum hederae CBS 113979 TaxID=1176131 RepID=A0A6G1H9Q5_9PEZI|nr:hypothetical protein K402DRAFT_326299 [Aulographum hederae CBS 113979]